MQGTLTFLGYSLTFTVFFISPFGRFLSFRSEINSHSHFSECMGAYHLLELTAPKELVLICVNGKSNAGLCDYSDDPCVEYTKELM